jgi:hypothetical protein
MVRGLLAFTLLFGCGAPLPLDSPVDAGWVTCTSSQQCPASLPMCDPVANVCTGCIEGNGCPAGQACDQKAHRCVPTDPQAPCLLNSDCPRPGADPPSRIICRRPAGVCVQCLADTDCVPGTVCDLQGTAPTFTCGGGW